MACGHSGVLSSHGKQIPTSTQASLFATPSQALRFGMSHGFGVEGLGFRVWSLGHSTPKNENNMEKNRETEMESGII